MSTSKFIIKSVLFVGILTLPVALHAAISLVIVNKESFFYQGGPAAEDVFLSDGYWVLAEVQADNQSDVSNVSVRPQGGSSIPMSWNAQEERYMVEADFPTLAALNSAYPDGNYTVTFTPSGGSQVSKTLNLTGGFPNTPVVENWFDMQHFPVGEDVTVRWSPMSGGAAKDVINLEIVDRASSDRVFETGVHYFGDPNSLDGTDTSVTIPAGTLQVGQDYEIILGFNQIDQIDIGQTLPDVLMAAIHYTETNMNLVPVNRHPSTVIDWGVVGRWTRYDQTDAVTINPRNGQDFAAVQAIIAPGSTADLSSATMNGQHSLVSVAEQGQWLFVQPLSNEVELASWLPNGDVSLAWSFSAGGSHSTRLNLDGGPMNPVRISNWSELQSVDATTVTPIRWMAPEFWRDFDAFIVAIADENEDIVFETPVDLDSADMLRGEDRSVDIPAGTLEAEKIYHALIQFIQITDFDENSQAGAFFAAANAVETVFTINTGAAAGPDPVEIGAVGREVYYVQTGQGAPVLDFNDDQNFTSFAGLFGESLGSLTNAQVVLPGGAVRNMSFDPEEGWISETKNDSVSGLLADFPAGDYTLRYQVPGSSQVEVSVNLNDVRPGAPQVTNWNEAQSVLATEPFTIAWLPIENMTEADAVEVFVEDGQDEVFGSGFKLFDGVGLDGDAVAVTIPAGTLEPGRTYYVTVDAVQFTDLDQDTRPGQSFVAANISSTGFNLVTTSGNQPPSITTEFLDDAQEGMSYSFDVVGADPEDGSSVTMNVAVIPSWLGFNDQGNGTLRLTGNPTAANVGVFTVTVSVTDSQGLMSDREFSLAVNPDLSDPEGRALDIGGINWLRDQASPFEAQISDVQFGESALISGAVGDGATSFLQGTFTGPLKLSFYWKVSSETGKDFFRVKVDDTVEAEISGEKNWRQQIIDLPAGSHSVVWSYEKDGAGKAGADRGWVDHLMILPAEAGVYAGTYLGEIASSTGEVSLYVRPNNTAVFLGYHPESGKGLSSFAFDVSEFGSFSFEVVDPDDMNSNYTVTGSIDNGVATGSVSGLNLTFSADLVSGGGQLVSYDGYYQNALAATTSGLVYLIVATDGQAYFYAEDGDYIEGFITTIDQAGKIVLKTTEGVDYDLQVDPSTDIVSGTYTPPGGEPSGVLGIREGSPGDELLANISTRGKVLTGGKIMIASFVITGEGSKQLLIRAIGPKLSDFSVPGVLEDPVIELVRLGELVPMAVNDNWGDGGHATKIAEESIRLGAFPLNSGGRDSVMSISLEPGKYTARVKGIGGLTGVGLVEVYDADDPADRLSTADVVNIATRGEVGTGGDALIAGFVVSGDVPKRILLRGIGPQLTQYGLTGVLEDPQIELTNKDKELVASNNDWGDNPDVPAVVSSTQQVGAFALDDGSKDSALLIWLEPGAYTAKVTGADGGTGVALIEVYDN